jgi:hypothetical protein
MNDGVYSIGGWQWRGKCEVLWEKPVPVPLCAPQVPLGPTSGSSRAVAVRDQRIPAWEMARRNGRLRPADHWPYFLGTLPRPVDLILLFSLCVSCMNLYVLTSFEVWFSGQARWTVGPIFCYDLRQPVSFIGMPCTFFFWVLCEGV